jgi:3-dehydroquinate dehydratase
MTTTLPDIEAMLRAELHGSGRHRLLQTNHEGTLIDEIHLPRLPTASS